MSDRKIKINLVPGPVSSTLGILTAMLGFHIHGSLVWACLNFLAWPLSLCYWLVTKQLTVSTIKGAFAFLLQ
jgi:hypothetical protein